MSKDIGHVLSTIFIPGIPQDLLAVFLDKGIIHDEKECRMGFDQKRMRELVQGDFYDLLRGLDALSQESGEAGKWLVQKGAGKGLNHRRGVGFFAWLHEADGKAREILKESLEQKLGNRSIFFWIDVASCPPMDPKILTGAHRHMPNLWSQDSK
jgi:hypothetical protein